ncbi:Bor family protein, partial [Escherichia coli]|nr:Bor family protein [Escherichia coli]
GNKPTAVTPKETITHHFFVSGIGQKTTVDAATICGGAENVVKTETQQTFVNGLLGFITLGIYTPLEARVYCSQ